MFLQWKLIYQKINLRNLFLILFGGLFVILFVILAVVFASNSCNFERLLILDDVSTYEKSLDPELCEIVVEKIDIFNDECESNMEILDCS